MSRVGRHDVVFCAGVFYHTPNPFQLLHNLHGISGQYLLLGGHTLPEVLGLEGACVFYPKLGAKTRRMFARTYPRDAAGLSKPFDMTPLMGYAGWWWGITPSAMRSMLAMAGFDVLETIPTGRFITDFVARRLDRPSVIPPLEFTRLRGERREARAASP